MKKKLYDPFYTFTTMAMEHVRVTMDAWDTHTDALHDIRNCGYFGRPLFAVHGLPPGDLAVFSPYLATTANAVVPVLLM
jgi:hypothetical protein